MNKPANPKSPDSPKPANTPLTKEQVLEKLKEPGNPLKGLEIGDVDFGGHVFEEAVDFQRAIFTGNAGFVGAKFKQRSNFYKAKFEQMAGFDLVVFGAKTSFLRAEFGANTSFDEAVFGAEANFFKAKFGTEDDFNKAVANFVGAKFEAKVSFAYAEFWANGKFQIAKFKAEADFSGAQFKAKADFELATFSDSVLFVGDPDEPKDKDLIFTKGMLVNFRNVTFKKPREVLFRGAYLGDCSFTSTDVSEIFFSAVEWGIKRWAFFTREKVLCDELPGKKDKDYRLIEETYRQLKINYEARGSYGQAGDFHYGEMEMQRLAQKRVVLNTLYKWFSGYGERYLRAFWSIIIFTGLCAWFYLMIGIKAGSETINYEWAFNWQFCCDCFSGAVLHALEVATFARRPVFTAVSKWTSGIEIIQRITTPILVTLLILAIKRRFKR